MKQNIKHQQKGALLLEILVVTAILGVILSLGAQMIYVSLQSNKIAGDRDVAIGILNETIEAVRSIGDEQWSNIYSLTKPTQHYYPKQSGGKWVTTSGDEVVTMNGILYTRYFAVSNVNRCNDTSRGIASSTSCSPSNNYSDDPSTQKVTVTVSWSGSEPISQTEYLLRWRNKVTAQTSWTGSGGESGTNVTTGNSLQITP